MSVEVEVNDCRADNTDHIPPTRLGMASYLRVDLGEPSARESRIGNALLLPVFEALEVEFPVEPLKA